MGSKPRLLKNYFNEGITKKRKSTTTERKKLQSCIQEKTENSEWQREWENNTSYTTLNYAPKMEMCPQQL